MRLICGDCLVEMHNIPAGSVDMILCDLPYAVTNCAWDSIIPFEPLWEHYRRVIKPRGAIALFCKQPFTSALITSNPRMFRYCWYWEKSKGANFAQTGYRPLAVVEEIAIFSCAPAVWSKVPTMNYYAQKEPMPKPIFRRFAGTLRGSKETRSDSAFCRNPERLPEKTFTDKTPRNLLYASDDKEDGLHPTQKPVALMEYLIKTYTNEGETVLDNCCGSGTTGVACKNLNRDFIGIEKDPGYFAIAQDRTANVQADLLTDCG